MILGFVFCHIFLSKQHINDYMIELTIIKIQSDDDCPICLDKLNDEKIVLQTNCGHHFHKECLTRSIKTSEKCPICRATFQKAKVCF